MTGKIISRKSELTENYYYENLKKKNHSSSTQQQQQSTHEEGLNYRNIRSCK